MFSCRIENYTNDILTLTQNENDFQVINIEGLNPPNAQINISAVAGMDGAKFNSSKLDTRNLVIYIKICGDIERNRLKLYSFFVTKQWCKFYYKNNSLDVFIEGYIESVECGLFTDNETMQVSVICTDPYFKSAQEIINDISKVVKLFEFPFAIEYEPSPMINHRYGIEFSRFEANRIVYLDGNSATGIIIEAEIYQPVKKIEILKVDENLHFTLKYDFRTSDRIIINTAKGHKSAVLIRDDDRINLFTAIEKGSVFFQLKTGENSFTYRIDDMIHDRDVTMRIRHRNQYQGV
ncbi:MAG: phage tail family protein [Ruminococcus sp.]|nr:phage tail family protein [Ruminococcus sp.]